MKKQSTKTGRPRRLTDEERDARHYAHLQDLKRWKKLHMKDPAYRAELYRRRKEKTDQLERDAEFGRIARKILQYLGAMMFDVGKPPAPPRVEFKHKTDMEVLAGMKRPFTPEQAGEYLELLEQAQDRAKARNGAGGGDGDGQRPRATGEDNKRTTTRKGKAK